MTDVVGEACTASPRSSASIIDAELLSLALTHRSWAYEHGQGPHNERLEFLGDSVLGQAVTVRLFTANPDLDEGALAKRRASVVSTVALAEVARSIGLGEHVLLGRGEELTGGRDKDSILADTMEAVIGATYLSVGPDAATALVLRLIDPLLERSRALRRCGRSEDEPAGARVADRGGVPRCTRSPRPDPITAGCSRRRVTSGEISAQGTGSSKKQAEMAAALLRVARAQRRACLNCPRSRSCVRAWIPPLTGATVLGVTVLDERALTRYDGSGAQFEAALTGPGAAGRGAPRQVPLAPAAAGRAGRRRRPKRWSRHLGMSGQLLLRSPGAEPERHERVRLDIQHPEHGELAVVFADQRTFGSLTLDPLVPTPDAAPGGCGTVEASVPSQVAHIARDPLDPAFRDARLPRGARAQGLRDQARAAGPVRDQRRRQHLRRRGAVGARASIRRRPRARCSTRAVNRLLAEVRAVLEQALAEGGTSFDAQYVNVNGQAGYFAHSLNAYGRTGEPCPRCGRPIVRVSFMNRSSHYCPHCQKLRADRALSGGSCQHLLPRARVRRGHEADGLVDVEHVPVLLRVEGRDARRLGHQVAPAEQVRALDDRAEATTAVVLQHERAVLLGRSRVVFGDHELVVGGDRAGRHVLHARDRDGEPLRLQPGVATLNARGIPVLLVDDQTRRGRIGRHPRESHTAKPSRYSGGVGEVHMSSR